MRSGQFGKSQPWSESMPEVKPQRRGDEAKQPELPRLRAVAKHVAAVADCTKGAEADVKSVCQQAEAGKEAKEPSQPPEAVSCSAKYRGQSPEEKRHEDADNRSSPSNDE